MEQGDVPLFSDFEDSGEMWAGDGPRQSRIPVAFSEDFNDLPAVMVNVSMFDASNDSNMRYDIQAEGISPKGFDIVFRTWGDTKVARVRASWQAIGALRTEEVWDI